MAGGKRGGQGGRGAKPGSVRKGAPRGSGGKGRKALSGKGPTPRAEERYAHPAARPGGQSGRSGGKGGPPATKAGPSRGGRDSRTAGSGSAGAEFVTGRNSVVEALRAGVPATALYVSEQRGGSGRDERTADAVRVAQDAGVPLRQARRDELERMVHGTAHQGLALRVAPYDYLHADDLLARARGDGRAPLLVALDGVTDPHNLGAITRSVAALGGHGILVPERRAAGVTAGAWKSSAGALARVPVARAANLVRTLNAYRSEGLFVVGLAGSGEMPVGELELAAEPLVVVVGSEDKGLSRLAGEACDLTVRVPMTSAAESLNASVATAVALYEISRRRA